MTRLSWHAAARHADTIGLVTSLTYYKSSARFRTERSLTSSGVRMHQSPHGGFSDITTRVVTPSEDSECVLSPSLTFFFPHAFRIRRVYECFPFLRTSTLLPSSPIPTVPIRGFGWTSSVAPDLQTSTATHPIPPPDDGGQTRVKKSHHSE